MVVLNRIYTRTGDGGETRLSDMSLTRKTDPRVEAYGTVDETNSILGMVLATGDLPESMTQAFGVIQNELFDLGADLSNPLVANPKYEPLRITAGSIDRLERWCDEYSEGLPKLRSFILPGGNPAGAWLHLARTVCRRAERAAWIAVETYGTEVAPDGADKPGGVNPDAVKYLNRLSDLLFICSRAVNGTESEVLWVPGGDRGPDAGAEAPEA